MGAHLTTEKNHAPEDAACVATVFFRVEEVATPSLDGVAHAHPHERPA